MSIRVRIITQWPLVCCVGLWVLSSGAEPRARSRCCRMQSLQGVDERGWGPPLPPPRAKPSVASWPFLSFKSDSWMCWPLALQAGAGTLQGPLQERAASPLCPKVPSSGPRAVPRPWGQADASMQDLRVAAIISNKGLVFTKVIADSLGGGVGPPVQRVPPPCQDSRIL